MSPTIRHKYKYFHSTLQGAKDRRQKFHFCRLSFDVRPLNVKLNLSINKCYSSVSPHRGTERSCDGVGSVLQWIPFTSSGSWCRG